MSIENYSQELRNFITNNTKFINDQSFQTKEQLSENTQIIEDYIEREMSFDEIKCLFFYLTYLIKDDLFRNTIISNINKNFAEKNIKAREMPDIHYIVVYKINFYISLLFKIKNNYQKINK